MLPLTSYWLVKHYSKTAVVMPPRYFYDDVSVLEKNGRKIPDTLWHRVKGVAFTDQFGRIVSIDQIKNRVIVLNFFFTRCPSICPGLTKNMKRLQDSFKGSDTLVHFISISVDPENDSTPQLRQFADRFNVNHDNWWFVRGNKEDVYNFALKEMKASIADTQVDTAFIHTENFFLLDTTHVVRGWYNGFDEKKLSRLAADIPLLMLEKNKKGPSVFSRLVPIIPIMFIVVAMVAIVIILLIRNKKKLYELSGIDSTDTKK
jgi:protein SCO1/2